MIKTSPSESTATIRWTHDDVVIATFGRMPEIDKGKHRHPNAASPNAWLYTPVVLSSLSRDDDEDTRKARRRDLASKAYFYQSPLET